MRFLLKVVMFFMIVSSIHLTVAQAHSTEDKHSIIVEIDGDPSEQQQYIETYYPLIDVVATYDTLFNGLALQGTPDKLSKIHSLDFIKTIHPVHIYEAIDKTSIPLGEDLKSTQLMTENMVLPHEFNETTYTGLGVKVGVVDTGIDYNHPDLEVNYQGGYDVVDLDDDPMETIPEEGEPTSHGTHVAGIIAANGDLQGVAPHAEIYAYRALGPGGQGTSIQVIAAMEQAVKDGVDVMNLSLGNSVNGPDYPTSQAVNKAVDLGVAVVIANGNDGPNDWTVGSPATATKAVAVGAKQQTQTVPFLVDSLEDKKIPLTHMIGSVPWNIDKAYEVVHGNDQNVSGKIALFERSDIPFYDLAKEAEESGARAVFIYSDEEGPFQGVVQHDLDPISIPVIALLKEEGEWLSEQVNRKTFYADVSTEEVASNIASFSSRGPVTVNWEIKPDVIAPGTNILSTVPGGYQELQGTSMAAPHVAGSIAVLKEAQPNWTNEQIIGALKTTANQLTTEDQTALDPIVQGMGDIQIDKAINTETIIYNPLLSFGKMDEYKETKTIDVTVENTTNEEQTYSFNIPKKSKGFTWKLPQTFTLEGKEKKTIPIELSIMTSLIDEGVYQGWLQLQQKDKTYELPYLFVNQTADYPKAMGFGFSLKPFSNDEYMYNLYLAEEAQHIQVDLYDPDSLRFERTLLQLEDANTGMNEGHVKQSNVGEPGYYKAIVTVQLETGEYESHETDILIE